MKLRKVVRPEEVRLDYHKAIFLEAGETVAKALNDMDLMEETVPIGKRWEVGIDINVHEEDTA